MSSDSEDSSMSSEDRSLVVYNEFLKIQHSPLLQEYSISRKIARILPLLPPLSTWGVIEIVCYKLGSFWDVSPTDPSSPTTASTLRRDHDKRAMLRHEMAFDLVHFLTSPQLNLGHSHYGHAHHDNGSHNATPAPDVAPYPGWGFPIPSMPGVSQVHLVFHDTPNYSDDEKRYLVSRSDFFHDESVFVAVFDSDTPNEERDINGIDRHQMLWIAPNQMIPIMQVRIDGTKQPAAILWRDQVTDGWHDGGCRFGEGRVGRGPGEHGVHGGGGGSRGERHGHHGHGQGGGGGDGFRNHQHQQQQQQPPIPVPPHERPMSTAFPGYKKFCLDRHPEDSKYALNSSALYIRADIVDQNWPIGYYHHHHHNHRQ
ncbi:hypothetical protein QBC32DRAFT_327253 [Pseudoneurospora amorphoporcata]|uniref:Uncharacterized protein n=1 Tax=Pseudoneurospora amorphoporcata TaxID=241081 RepID=A0AAN6SDL1_9PEZI|nr:hypothetical protein QBC32DRAFT_327253 [Pseudoneurospora amorphoporcata]